MHVCMHACMYVRMCVYACICVCMYVCMSVCLSVVAGLATREELVKEPVSDVLQVFAMKGVARMLGKTVSNVYALQAILERDVKKVCFN